MSVPKPTEADRFRNRMHREMLDSVDEELELELDDRRFEGLSTEIQRHPEVHKPNHSRGFGRDKATAGGPRSREAQEETGSGLRTIPPRS